MDAYIKQVQAQFGQLMHALAQELSGVRTNRPSPQLVENIPVEYAGEQLMVKQLGTISVSGPKEMLLTLWDKSATPAIAKAIEKAQRGFSVSVEGSAVRLKMPPLTDERREELGKLVKSAVERTRIRVRAARDEANKRIETALKEKAISENQKFAYKKQVQDMVDKINGEIEAALEKKLQEISE